MSNEKNKSILVGVRLKIHDSVDYNIGHDYEYTTNDGHVYIELKTPKPFDNELPYKIENQVRIKSFVNQIFSDRPWSVELVEIHVMNNGVTHVLKFGIPAHIRQSNPPKNLLGSSGEEIFSLVEKHHNKEDLATKLFLANGEKKPLTYLIECYSKGRTDGAREFEHYYEVVDFFKGTYSDKEICAKLHIERKKWGDLISVLNDKRYYQSKHRGQTTGGTEWAPDEKVWFARNTIKEIIIKFWLSKEFQ